MTLSNEDFELTLFDRLEVIKNTIKKYGEENFYLSFSGGGDSTILHYMLDEALPGNQIPRVYINTGIEYADVTKYVLDLAQNDDRIKVILPKTNIKKMLEDKGYPFKSKEHSAKVATYQKNGSLTRGTIVYLTATNDAGEPARFACPKCLRYQFTPECTLKISPLCCNELKKKPARQYEKESGRTISIQGIRQAEGGQRGNHAGCLTYRNDKLHVFKPLNPVSDAFMHWYEESRGIKLCKLYYPPYNFKRTGCKGCPFAIDIQKQLDVMEELLPFEKIQCETIWKPVYAEYRRIGYRLRKD